MNIIDEAKKKVFDKPISIFEKAKNNFENHQRLKSAREHLRLNSSNSNKKRVRFGSVAYNDTSFNILINQNENQNENKMRNSITVGKNKRNSIVFFPTFNKSSNSIKRYSDKNKTNINNLHVIHENHNEKHEENISEKNSDSSFENDDFKKYKIKNNKSESMTQTYFNKKEKVKLDQISILFSKAHNQKLISFCGMKNYDNIIFSSYFGRKKKNNDRLKKEKEEVNLFDKKIKLVKRYRIDIEDSAEGKKRKKKFLDNIIELRTYISNSKTQPVSLRETYK